MTRGIYYADAQPLHWVVLTADTDQARGFLPVVLVPVASRGQRALARRAFLGARSFHPLQAQLPAALAGQILSMADAIEAGR